MVDINLRTIKEGNFRQYFVFAQTKILCDMQGVWSAILSLCDGDFLTL